MPLAKSTVEETSGFLPGGPIHWLPRPSSNDDPMKMYRKLQAWGCSIRLCNGGNDLYVSHPIFDLIPDEDLPPKTHIQISTMRTDTPRHIAPFIRGVAKALTDHAPPPTPPATPDTTATPAGGGPTEETAPAAPSPSEEETQTEEQPKETPMLHESHHTFDSLLNALIEQEEESLAPFKKKKEFEYTMRHLTEISDSSEFVPFSSSDSPEYREVRQASERHLALVSLRQMHRKECSQPAPRTTPTKGSDRSESDRVFSWGIDRYPNPGNAYERVCNSINDSLDKLWPHLKKQKVREGYVRRFAEALIQVYRSAYNKVQVEEAIRHMDFVSLSSELLRQKRPGEVSRLVTEPFMLKLQAAVDACRRDN